jgi:hypothetical protein
MQTKQLFHEIKSDLAAFNYVQLNLHPPKTFFCFPICSFNFPPRQIFRRTNTYSTENSTKFVRKNIELARKYNQRQGNASSFDSSSKTQLKLCSQNQTESFSLIIQNSSSNQPSFLFRLLRHSFGILKEHGESLCLS